MSRLHIRQLAIATSTIALCLGTAVPALAADAAPTQAQQAAAQDLSRDWQALAAYSVKIWQEQLAIVNQALAGARLPALRGDDSPSEEGESNDEE